MRHTLRVTIAAQAYEVQSARCAVGVVCGMRRWGAGVGDGTRVGVDGVATGVVNGVVNRVVRCRAGVVRGVAKVLVNGLPRARN